MSTSEKRRPLLKALRSALLPITRLLMRAGIRFEDFASLAKSVYVESAIRDSSYTTLPSRKRVAAVTGLTNMDVDHCIDGNDVQLDTERSMTGLLVEVLNKWHTAPEYAGPYGIPLELEFATPPNRSIQRLVEQISPDANPQQVLRELLNAGAVAPAGRNRYRATSRVFMRPDAMSLQAIEYYSERMSRLASTLEYNLSTARPTRRLERCAVADRGVPVHLLPEFETYARGKAMNFLLEVDNWLTSQVESAEDCSPNPHRTSAGVNVFLHATPP
ncbi:MAG: DUF6502 family protein [Steroidobacteraceae bacterium]